jgi:hypothetical protein
MALKAADSLHLKSTTHYLKKGKMENLSLKVLKLSVLI